MCLNPHIGELYTYYHPRVGADPRVCPNNGHKIFGIGQTQGSAPTVSTAYSAKTMSRKNSGRWKSGRSVAMGNSDRKCGTDRQSPHL